MTFPNPFGKDYICHEPTALQVTQHYWSWFKNTGRGFTITYPGSETPLFVVETKQIGKKRCIEDRHGKPLCRLERNYLSKQSAWSLTRDDGKKLFTVVYNWCSWSMHIHMNDSENDLGGIELRVKNLDTWGSCFAVSLGDKTIMRMRCTNMMNNFLSSFKITPPRWDVDIVEGVDLVLAAALAVVVSDSYSEMHIYMC
ncbi:hypothetical protein PHISCL_09700 [Aspergillus sclerotialis]|uniref:Tubby C-terminal-like domain-containing protein n=1 Tax=Aspergillus sclerotialis TaxID=2070753 RepID=A0A3A2ZF69_9EURO|nr:hypothetical protein PHISCL_09700 [Aspergillus sclerotialis]